MSFCGNIRGLKQSFFAKIFRGKPLGSTPKAIFATGTMAKEHVNMTSAMTMIGLSHDSILWSELHEF
jgi:hypothetical protein